jgi:hypothetical protein
MPFVFNPITGQDATLQRKQQQQQPPALGGSDDAGTNKSFSLQNSSVYLNETNAANAAYEKAKAQLLANRNSLYHQYGLTDTGAVDVNNPYGEYQSLLGTEGAALDSAHNDAIARGLGSGGLANQGEASLIPQQRLEQLGFQRQVDQTGSDYASGLEDAASTKTGAYNTAYQDALQDALARGLFDAAPDASSTATTSLGGTTIKKNKPLSAFVYNPKIAANKTGASARKRGGIYTIH